MTDNNSNNNNKVDALDPKFNCTLEIFATAKNLPIEFLRDTEPYES